MEFSFTFIAVLFTGIYMMAPLFGLMLFLIISLGLIAGRMESWSKSESIYWAFITGLTVGYGDYRPTKKASRVLSGVIAILGIMMAGIVVAITVEASSVAFEKHIRPEMVMNDESS